MEVLSQDAVSRNTYLVAVSFTNSEGSSAEPTSATWTLTDEYGNVINDREDEEITTFTDTVIVLYGDDIDQEDSPTRIVTIDSVYDSDTYGDSLPARQQISFSIGEWTEPEVEVV